MKTIVITGASSGLGQEVAKQLAKHNLYLLSRTKPSIENSKKCRWIKCDVASKEEVVSACLLFPKTVDIFIHCAGIGLLKEFYKTSFLDIDKIIKTNVLGALYISREIYKKMVSCKNGHIVIVSSTSGKKTRENETVYCSSKFAQAGFSESLRLEAIKHNIKVTTVYPGGMRTNFYNNQPKKDTSSFMDPKDVAKQIVALLNLEKNCVISQITIERFTV